MVSVASHSKGILISLVLIRDLCYWLRGWGSYAVWPLLLVKIGFAVGWKWEGENRCLADTGWPPLLVSNECHPLLTGEEWFLLLVYSVEVYV